jgi:hypothetical protein
MASAEGSSVSEANPAEEFPSTSTATSFHIPRSLNDSVYNDYEVSTVYFTVGERHEAALVPRNAPSDDVKGTLNVSSTKCNYVRTSCGEETNSFSLLSIVSKRKV